MHTQLKARVIALAQANPLIEICGLFLLPVGALQAVLVECANQAANPAEEFEIGVDDQVAARSRGDLLGVYHSHPIRADGEARSFSPADLECAEELALPFYLYDGTTKVWHEYIPSSYKVDLLGRPFTFGFNDCYGFVRDYYRQAFNLHLNDYDRDESFMTEDEGIIMANFEREGFVLGSLSTLQPHDALMFKTDRVLPQHFAILKGHQMMLHHPQNLLSREEMITDRWLSRLVCVFRYGKALPAQRV